MSSNVTPLCGRQPMPNPIDPAPPRVVRGRSTFGRLFAASSTRDKRSAPPVTDARLHGSRSGTTGPMTPQALNPDQQAHARQVIRPHLPLLLRTATYMTRHEQDAQDLVQDAVLKAMRAIDRFEPGTDGRAWLLTILRRTQIDRARARQRRGNPLSLNEDDGLEPADTHGADVGMYDQQWDEPGQLMERFGEQQIIDALRSLAEEIRWALLLVDVEGLEHAEAAAVLEVPVGTVKSRASRGRAMLRDRLFEFAAERGWIAKGKRHDA